MVRIYLSIYHVSLTNYLSQLTIFLLPKTHTLTAGAVYRRWHKPHSGGVVKVRSGLHYRITGLVTGLATLNLNVRITRHAPARRSSCSRRCVPARYFICITVAKVGPPRARVKSAKVRWALTVTSPLAVEHTSREWERSVYVVSGDPAAAIAGSAAPAIAAMAATEATEAAATAAAAAAAVAAALCVPSCAGRWLMRWSTCTATPPAGRSSPSWA